MAQRQSYRPLARLLHWSIAILVISTLPAGVVMTQEGLARPLQDTLFIYHKNVGVLILLLMLLRLAYRIVNPPPPLPPTVPEAQRRIAGLTHGLLYLLVFAMALSGYIRVAAGGFPVEALDWLGFAHPVPRSEALADTAKAVHFYVRFPLIGLIALHVGAALYHGLALRDGVLSRMLPVSGR